MTQGPEVTAAATFCATLVDEWARAGLRHAIVCPGSRSTPMALALAADGRLDVQVVHDERSAAFIALGIGLSTQVPAVVLTTSGTAAAQLHPAVVEAGLSSVPMIVCTADRPPELQDVGAPQTIDQVHLYGRSVRWFAAPEVPDERRADTWRPLACRAVAEATGPRPGPVHLNLAFRDPLVGRAGDLPSGRADGAPWARVVAGVGEPVASGDLVAALSGRRGLIVAGGPVEDPGAVRALGAALGWPVVAGPRATGIWEAGATGGVVSHADALVRVAEFAAERPEVVLSVGEPPASKLLGQWLTGVPVVAARGSGRWVDPDGQVELVVPETVLAAVVDRVEPANPAWRARWAAAEAAAADALVATLAPHDEPTEPAIARDVLAALPDGAELIVSSSMPVRDVEWYAMPRTGLRVHANRGANGIDGVMSTGVGVALGTGAPAAVLVGDVAFLHDSNALLALGARDVDLTIVVVDNDGGGIFSFLPQGTQLATDRFEQLFGTPHGVDLPALVAAHGLSCQVLTAQADVGPAVTEVAGRPGTKVILVRTDRAANVAVHDELHAAVAQAVTEALG
ncbi:MAG: 2-succinyl-5-enolpyruvyl-6-hydroxy-3-cyclohexene-1-carboxylic-acid synthase [Acidimicrobiales bacterium]|nr:2-succinyl-5-enolpyruvyl-6-hydroxy-3-cyclohexene-1-carboxylic-acid synthase [Acidimicrobiales bacterium]